MDKEYLSTKELAQKVGVAVQTIHNNTYKIKGRVKVGGRVKYKLSVIERELQKGMLF